MASHRVLLTGANGFIGQHILAVFLEAGHSVRSIVRSESKIAQLSKTFQKYTASKQLDFGIVADMTAPGAFDSVLQSEPPFDIVVHSASPFNYRKNSQAAEFLNPAIKGTTEVLNSIAAHAPSVKRVVLTGSMASVIHWLEPKITHPAKVYTGDDWNPATWDYVLESTSPNVAYQGSKKFAEKAGWDFVEQRKPNFDLAVINPPMVYGPLYDPSVVAAPKDLPESLFGIYNGLMRPDLTAESPLPPDGLHLYADVRDVAAAHMLAATTPEAHGKRFVVCGGELSNQLKANLLREALPELSQRIPRGEPEKATLPEGTYQADASLAKEVLGLKFHSTEETMKDLAAQLYEIEKKSATASQ